MRSVHLLDELEAALASGTDTRRIEILTRITDLFVGGASSFSEEQIGVFDSLMARLVHRIEGQARVKLAHRLAPLAKAPANVIHMLAFDDDFEVARPVLSQSERLDEPELVANARSKSQQHLFAITQRKSLGEPVTDVLVERGENPVVHALVKNSGARFSDAGFRILVRRSSGDDALAAQIGMRSDIPRLHLLMLLQAASAAVRTRLAAENPRAAGDIAGIVTEAAGSIGNAARRPARDIAAVRVAMERQHRSGRIGESEIISYVRERKFEETAIALSTVCDMPIDVVERALLHPRAEIVLILAKVAGLSWMTVKAILQLRASDRGVPAKDLDQALSNFNRLQPANARHVLGFFRTSVKKPTARMAPPAVSDACYLEASVA